MMERRIIGVDYEESQAHVTMRRGNSDIRTIITIQEEGRIILSISNWRTGNIERYETTLEKFYESLRDENEPDMEII